ncbi:hypothetical protein B2G69_09010 [Methylorubrum zatmanii]|nr:hypothetical protein [Methylorubrum zatmanii]ARO54278.1 hypothetical protein B2G69_09010 [Methylorubrum zatmanii]
MATHMERHIIEVCLGHTLKGIGATYRHYSYLAEKTDALQVRANELAPEQAQDTFKCDSCEENVRDEEAAQLNAADRRCCEISPPALRDEAYMIDYRSVT